ncbi:hypothetical protein ECWI1_998 [Escherichia coli]|nr:hypothetical protein ECWI2_1002 [Escherichia coli]SMB24170.1 hypothetical protein ECWI1_998 [Escherichia coli]
MAISWLELNGLSPLTRGTQDNAFGCFLAGRFIPADAGNS